MGRFTRKRLVAILCKTAILGVATTQVLASGFQLWEQDAASVGSYHAGYAAEAYDASTAFYNPAGITRFKNQQLVLGGDAVMTNFKYTGTIGVNTVAAGEPEPVTAQGGNFGFVPFLHFVAPITDWIGFGFSVDVPFGLKTTYGRKTIVQYAATTTAATVVDISPSLGIQITDKSSIGFGLDIQSMQAEFDSVGVIGNLRAESVNKVSDTGYGGRAGVLYQFSENSRLGISYHSQVVHHLNGSSQFTGSLATDLNNGPYSSQTHTNMTLPPYVAISLYQRVHPKLALMGSAIFTRWDIFKAMVLDDVAAVQDAELSRAVQVTVLQYYRNTWNLSVGANYYATDRVTLRTGLGYDQTPVTTPYRTVQMPDNNRVVIACGGHYQATNTLGVDLGWQHIFLSQAPIHPQPQIAGDQVVTMVGNAKGGADVLGAQITWDIV